MIKLKTVRGQLPFKSGQAAVLFDAASPLPCKECTVDLVTEDGVLVTIDGARVLLNTEQALHRLLTMAAYASLAGRLPHSGDSPRAEETMDDNASGLDGGPPVERDVRTLYNTGDLVCFISKHSRRSRTRYLSGYVDGTRYVFGMVRGRKFRSRERIIVACPLDTGGHVDVGVPVAMLQKVGIAHVPDMVKRGLSTFVDLKTGRFV